MGSALAALVLVLAGCASSGTAAAPDWSAIQDELARRVERDQAAREELMAGAAPDLALFERLATIDAENTAWMKALVAAHGWPTSAAVGAQGAGNAWLLVQHADQDVDFQEQCLALLHAAVAAGQAEARHLAYLHDRVAMARGRPQRYGTQFVQRDGRFEPYALEDAARVDEWRAEVGLGTLAEYTQQIRGSR